MPVAALITVNGDQPGVPEGCPALQHIFGQSLLERQVKQLARAGVGHVVLFVPALPSALIRVIDRLKSLRISVELTRSARDAADRVHPEERLIVVDGGLMLPDAVIADLAGGSTNMILTVPDAADPHRFERIDAKDRWAGAMALNGNILRQTAGILGEWDLAPTLLRCALQQGCDRISLIGDAEDHRLVRPFGMADMALATKSLAQSQDVSSGMFRRWVARPLASKLMALATRPILSHNLFRYGTIILYLLSFILTAVFVPWTGFVVFILASVGYSVTAMVRATLLEPSGVIERVLEWRGFLLGAMLIIAAARAPAGLGMNVPSILALWCAMQWALIDQLRARIDAAPAWQADSGAIAVIMAIAAALTLLPIGLALVLVFLIFEQFWRQRRLPLY